MRIFDDGVQQRSHLRLAALGEEVVVLLASGRSAPVHDEVATGRLAGRALVAVAGRIVLGAEVVAHFVCERELRDECGHTRLVVDHGQYARVEALAHALHRLTLLAHAARTPAHLGHPRET